MLCSGQIKFGDQGWGHLWSTDRRRLSLGIAVPRVHQVAVLGVLVLIQSAGISATSAEAAAAAAEEIELAHQVQQMKQLSEIPLRNAPQATPAGAHGLPRRDRMMAANLRLVVSVAKKYQTKASSYSTSARRCIGLERAVDKFDPAMGYKFSTYAYWWIRQTTRAIDNSARTIRLPIHISEKLSKMRRITRELTHRFGRQPNRLELAHAMGMEPDELEELLSKAPFAIARCPRPRRGGSQPWVN